MKIIDNRQLAGLSSMADLKAMQLKIDRQVSYLRRHMGDHFARANEKYSYAGIAHTAFTVLDNIQSVFRYARKGHYR